MGILQNSTNSNFESKGYSPVTNVPLKLTYAACSSFLALCFSIYRLRSA